MDDKVMVVLCLMKQVVIESSWSSLQSDLLNFFVRIQWRRFFEKVLMLTMSMDFVYLFTVHVLWGIQE